MLDPTGLTRPILAVVVALLFFVGCNPSKLPGFKQVAEHEQQRITKETQDAINGSPERQELDRLQKSDSAAEGFCAGEHAS